MPDEITNTEKLRLLGEAMHGTNWQNAVARDLKLNVRQIHRWVSGQYEPNRDTVAKLADVARVKRDLLDVAIRRAAE